MLSERLAALDEQIEALFAGINRQDGQENDLFGESHTPNRLPPELADVKRRQAALEKALEKARATEARRPRKEETKKKEKAVKVSVADPDAVIKQVMGLRRFLLRGVDKVRTEWRWACTAFNLQKPARYLGALRARLAAAMIQGPGEGSAPIERKVFGGDKAPLS